MKIAFLITTICFAVNCSSAATIAADSGFYKGIKGNGMWLSYGLAIFDSCK